MKNPNKILKHLRKRQKKDTLTVEIAVPMWIRQLPFDLFRYSLSIILFLGKIGLLDNTILEGMDWWLVFAPALFLEVGIVLVAGFLGAVYVIGLAVAAVAGLVYYGPQFVKSWWKYRKYS